MFDDFGGRAMGRAGRRLVYATIYAAILLNPVLLHLTSAEALEHSLPEARFHRTFAPIVVACLMAPLSQVIGSLPASHDCVSVHVLGSQNAVNTVNAEPEGSMLLRISSTMLPQRDSCCCP